MSKEKKNTETWKNKEECTTTQSFDDAFVALGTSIRFSQKKKKSTGKKNDKVEKEVEC